MSAGSAKVLFAAAAVAVAGAVIAALAVLGGPDHRRMQRLDEIRVQNLQALEVLVRNYVKLHKKLPDSFDALTREPGFQAPQLDPAGVPYRYERTGEDLYRLCAAFDLPSRPLPSSLAELWAHPAGHQCFDRQADVRAGTGASSDNRP